jgi:hypothetical protein
LAIVVLFSLPGFAWAFFFHRWFRDRPHDHPDVNAAERRLISQSPSNQPARTPGNAESFPAPRSTPWLALMFSPAMWMICGQQFCRGFGYMFYATWFATMNMVGNFGAAMFPVIVPWLLLWGTAGEQAAENWDAVLFAFGGVYLMSAACWLLLNPHGTVFDQSLWRRKA